jgi:hypothetical protein
MMPSIRETLRHMADDRDVDPMSFLLAMALAVATEDLDEEEMWDSPPRLCVVLRVDSTDESEPVGLRVSELGSSQHPRLPRDIDPMVLLRAAAEMFDGVNPELPTADIVAWLFVVEAWYLTGEHREELEKVAQERLVAADPDSVECRVAVMVDRTGRIYQTLTQRGGESEPTMLVTGPGGTAIADGRVIDALQHLMDVTPLNV